MKYLIALLSLLGVFSSNLAISSQLSAQIAEIKSIEAMVETTIEDYRVRQNYPDHSFPIPSIQQDPVLNQFNNTPHFIRSDEDQNVRVKIWTDDSFFQFPEPVVLYAQLENAQNQTDMQRQWYRKNTKLITADIVDQDDQAIATVRFQDKGIGKDKVAADGIYTGSFAFKSSQLPAVAGSYLVKLKAQTANDRWVQGSSGFLYSKPNIRLTGRLTHKQIENDLQVLAQVVVTEAGIYHFAGSLYQQDAPLGYAQKKIELEKGVHWVPMEFFGNLFSQHHLDSMNAGSHLSLKHLRVTDVSRMPNGPIKLKRDQYIVRSLDQRSIGKKPFVNPRMKSNIEKLTRMKTRLTQRRQTLEAKQRDRKLLD